jgi:hypothetical protein
MKIIKDHDIIQRLASASGTHVAPRHYGVSTLQYRVNGCPEFSEPESL